MEQLLHNFFASRKSASFYKQTLLSNAQERVLRNYASFLPTLNIVAHEIDVSHLFSSEFGWISKEDKLVGTKNQINLSVINF